MASTSVNSLVIIIVIKCLCVLVNLPCSCLEVNLFLCMEQSVSVNAGVIVCGRLNGVVAGTVYLTSHTVIRLAIYQVVQSLPPHLQHLLTFTYICIYTIIHTRVLQKSRTQNHGETHNSRLYKSFFVTYNISWAGQYLWTCEHVFILITNISNCTETLSTSFSRCVVKCHLCSDGNGKNVWLCQSIFTLFTWILKLICLELSLQMHNSLYLIIRLWKQLYCDLFLWFVLHLYFCGLFPTMLFLSILSSTVLHGIVLLHFMWHFLCGIFQYCTCIIVFSNG